MAAAKARQGSAIEHIEAAARLGDHVMLVTPMLEQRHLAEEVALFWNYLRLGLISTTASPLAMMNIASPASWARTIGTPGIKVRV